MSGPKNVEAKGKAWQDPSKFRIKLTGPGAGVIGVAGMSADLSMACTSFQVPEIAAAPLDEFTGEEWRFANGRLENMLVTITFKDYDNFTLYKMFAKGIQKMLRMYPDDTKINVHVDTAPFFQVSAFSTIVTFKDCMLINVSGPTLDNSATSSVGEFTITLKGSYVTT